MKANVITKGWPHDISLPCYLCEANAEAVRRGVDMNCCDCLHLQHEKDVATRAVLSRLKKREYDLRTRVDGVLTWEKKHRGRDMTYSRA